jgi:serine/threonine-protein kinase
VTHLGTPLDDRYRLVEPIGAGGMSVVWRGYDTVLERPVAIKLLAARFDTDEKSRQRVRREARAVGRLVHPHIAAVHDYGEVAAPSGVRCFIVMELVEGRSVTSAGAMDWRSAARVCAQTAAALAVAHEHGLVHRDVSAGNVLLGPAGVKVVDFGISAIVGERDSAEVLGTPAYLAPERLDGSPAQPASDVYALGVLLYQLITGGLPWPAGATTQAMEADRHRSPADLPPIPGLPNRLTELYRSCLAEEPGARPTAAGLAAELTVLAGAAPAPGPVPVTSGNTGPTRTRVLPSRRRYPASVLVLGAVLATALMCGGIAVAAGLFDRHPAGSSAGAVATSSAAGSSCTVAYHLTGQWDNGFGAAVDVTNTGDAEILGWTLVFRYQDGQRVSQLWNGELNQAGATVSVRNADYNGKIAPHATVSFGFNGEYHQRNTAPVDFRLNGTACTTEGT